MIRNNGQAPMVDAHTLTKALGGMWSGRYGLARCPTHADRKPSLKIIDDPRKRDGIDLHCFAGCDWKEVKAALNHQGLLTDNYARVDQRDRIARGRPQSPRTHPAIAQGEENQAIALKIWQSSVCLKRTLGWRYFSEGRGLDVVKLDEMGHALRWNERIDAVVALMTDPATSHPTGIHRTFLNQDTTKRERKMLGKQGVIRLSPDEAVTTGLGLVEGIEDGLAVLLSGWAPAWAATSAGAIERFPVLPGIESLTIFADGDATGLKAAQACAARWSAADRDVRISPAKELTDAA